MTADSQVVTREPGGSQSEAVYRPHLDGLRAVAVYLVLLLTVGSIPGSP
jgi:peptidoglycan/LPS O-acetylase OafA/YrhL